VLAKPLAHSASYPVPDHRLSHLSPDHDEDPGDSLLFGQKDEPEPSTFQALSFPKYPVDLLFPTKAVYRAKALIRYHTKPYPMAKSCATPVHRPGNPVTLKDGMMVKRTKIVATVGPSCASEDVLAAMAQVGMDLVRINTSHGTLSDHERYVRLVREAERAAERPLGIVLDTQGPKVRLGTLSEPVTLVPGEEIVLGEGGLPLRHGDLPRYVPAGKRVLLAEGTVELSVLEQTERALRCRVVRGGVISSGKGVNVPEVELPYPSLTPADRASLRMATELGVEYVALSFVKSPEDVRAARALLGDGPRVIAKVELKVAVDRMEEIVSAADGAMVARGDLGVEIGPYHVPVVQKRLVDLCNARAKPVIVATQMLRSMVDSPVPTRAEVNDVAAAVWDGADGVMLSEETAVGRYPVEAVRAMAEAAKAAEESGFPIRVPGLVPELVGQIPGACARAAVQIARDIGAAAIICATVSGWTARLVASFRPDVPVVATTPEARVPRALALVWGVIPLSIAPTEGTDSLARASIKAAKEKGVVKTGDQVVFTAGLPFWEPGTTNLVRVIRV